MTQPAAKTHAAATDALFSALTAERPANRPVDHKRLGHVYSAALTVANDARASRRERALKQLPLLARGTHVEAAVKAFLTAIA